MGAALRFQEVMREAVLGRSCRVGCPQPASVGTISRETRTSGSEGRGSIPHPCYQEKPARSEALRGTMDPDYGFHMLGKLQLLKLRADWKAQEGDRFTRQRFHDEVLRQGMPPIRMLRELMLRDSALWDQSL